MRVLYGTHYYRWERASPVAPARDWLSFSPLDWLCLRVCLSVIGPIFFQEKVVTWLGLFPSDCIYLPSGCASIVLVYPCTLPVCVHLVVPDRAYDLVVTKLHPIVLLNCLVVL